MNEPSSSLSRAQPPEMKGKEIKSKPRSSGCGCNKRTKASTSSNKIRVEKVHPASSNQIRTQQVPSAQINKRVIRRKTAVNHHTSAIKQNNPVQAKSLSKKQSVASTNNTNASAKQ